MFNKINGHITLYYKDLTLLQTKHVICGKPRYILGLLIFLRPFFKTYHVLCTIISMSIKELLTTDTIYGSLINVSIFLHFSQITFSQHSSTDIVVSSQFKLVLTW